MIQQIKNPAIEIHDLTVSYNKKPVLWDINLKIPHGKLIGIVGPNGAGKSTLLKTIMGILTPDSGHIKFLDQPLSQVYKKVSYVPQRHSVDWNFPISVQEVVMMGRYVHMGLFKRPNKKDHQIVDDCLKQVGIEKFATRQISQLSGGQQQRIFIARALAQQASIYLLDEPFTGVDASTETIILQILQKLTQANKTVVIVHHSLEAIARYCNYTILLNLHIHAAGPTEKVFTSTSLQQTYGGKLTILSEIINQLHKKELPTREVSHK